MMRKHRSILKNEIYRHSDRAVDKYKGKCEKIGFEKKKKTLKLPTHCSKTSNFT